MSFDAKIKAFVDLVQQDTDDFLKAEGYQFPKKVSMKNGKKYVKIDIDTYGKYMVDKETEIIYGIKGYGKVHLGKNYGTLDDMLQNFWGFYTPINRATYQKRHHAMGKAPERKQVPTTSVKKQSGIKWYGGI